MLYLKTEIDGQKRKVELYSDEIYATCFHCNKEFQIDEETLKGLYSMEWFSISSSLVSCCDGNKPILTRIK